MATAIDHIELADRRTVSLDEANHELNLGRTTGYTLAQAGRYPCRIFKVGNRWRVSRASLDALIDGDESHEAGAA